MQGGFGPCHIPREPVNGRTAWRPAGRWVHQQLWCEDTSQSSSCCHKTALQACPHLLWVAARNVSLAWPDVSQTQPITFPAGPTPGSLCILFLASPRARLGHLLPRLRHCWSLPDHFGCPRSPLCGGGCSAVGLRRAATLGLKGGGKEIGVRPAQMSGKGLAK